MIGSVGIDKIVCNTGPCVNNLFDKTYDTNVEGSIVYGAPRNFSITGTYQF